MTAVANALVGLHKTQFGRGPTASRLFMQVATADRFTSRIEELVGRNVHSFVSALDPDKAIAYEIFVFEPG